MEKFYQWAKTVKCKGRIGGPNGIRTRVTDVRGRCPRPLDDGTYSTNQLAMISYQLSVSKKYVLLTGIWP